MDKIDKGTALIVVDVQNDFCPGGALAVPDGNSIVPVINQYMDVFTQRRLTIILTRDWHPEKTTHFISGGGIWPPHCIQGTHGAEFHPELKIPESAIIVTKGASATSDDYSAFHAVTDDGESLSELLNRLGVKLILVGGLATDYCVKESVQSGIKHGFDVQYLEDAIAGVNVNPGDSDRAIDDMITAGAKKMTLKRLLE